MSADASKPATAPERWLAFVANLPTEDPAARMSVLRTLQSLGCAVMREGVFLLPDSPAARQGLTRLTEHIARMNGSAHLLSVHAIDEAQSRLFLGLFDRTGKYDELVRAVTSLKSAIGMSDAVGIVRHLAKHKRDFKVISALDFFPSEARERASAAIAEVEGALHALRFPEAQKPSAALDVTGKIYFQRQWATRKPLWADQLASAWLIRRFVDPEARLLWLEKNEPCPPEAIGYGFEGATFANSKDRVTFEQILAGFALAKNAALVRMGALLHALEAGDVGMAEAAGVHTLLQGAQRRAQSEEALLAEAEMTFDLLYEAYFDQPAKPA